MTGRTSCMVGLWLSPDTAAALTASAAVPPESLHITLCMMEMDLTAMSDVQRARMLTTVDDIAAWTAPLSGEITGMGRFYASESSDGMDVVWALPSIEGLAALRDRIVERLEECGLECSDEHEFMPHITLAYVAPGSASPIEAVPMLPLAFDRITVAMGEQQTEIPLRGWYEGGMSYADLTRIAATAPEHHFRLFNEASFAEPPATIPILPKPGSYEHPVYGTIAMTPERAANFIANHNAHIYQQQVPVLIDVDHELKMYGAVGYLGDMFLDDDGSVSAQAVWTDRGRSLIEADAFKYVSPEWWDVWTDGATGKSYEDVITGVAVCTNPYFKDDSLRPLVAREGRLIAPPKEGAVADVTKPTKTTAPPIVAAAMSAKPKGQTMTEPIQMSEELTLKFKELSDRVTATEAALTTSETARTAAEAQVKTLSEQIEADRAAALTKSFKDEVRGKSDANNVPYVGDIEYHVAMLASLSPEMRDKYMERERKIAIASRAEQAGLFRELGGDGHVTTDEDPSVKLATMAQTLISEGKAKSFGEAMTKLEREQPQLFRAYQANPTTTVKLQAE